MTFEQNDRARADDDLAAPRAPGSDDALEALDAMSEDEQVEVAGIRAEIDETRLEMGGTLNALGDRLEPSRLVDQAKENVREATIGRVEETAKGISDMVMETIKNNPIPAALAAAGLALLWKNRSQSSQQSSQQFRSQYESRFNQKAGPTAGYGANYDASNGGGIGGRASDAAATVGESVGSAVGTAAGAAQQATGEVIDRAGQTVEQVGWKLDRFMQASPLALGAIAVGAGAVIASILPETQQERKVLGDASRQVGSTVRDTVEQATAKAEEGMDRAEDTLDRAETKDREEQQAAASKS